MNRDEAIARLRRHEADLRRIGIRSLYVFGSTARGDTRPGSDVDLFFDYDAGRFGLLDLVRFRRSASELLGCNADVMTRTSIDPEVRSQIEAEAIRVF